MGCPACIDCTHHITSIGWDDSGHLCQAPQTGTTWDPVTGEHKVLLDCRTLRARDRSRFWGLPYCGPRGAWFDALPPKEPT